MLRLQMAAQDYLQAANHATPAATNGATPLPEGDAAANAARLVSAADDATTRFSAIPAGVSIAPRPQDRLSAAELDEALRAIEDAKRLLASGKQNLLERSPGVQAKLTSLFGATPVSMDQVTKQLAESIDKTLSQLETVTADCFARAIGLADDALVCIESPIAKTICLAEGFFADTADGESRRAKALIQQIAQTASVGLQDIANGSRDCIELGQTVPSLAVQNAASVAQFL
jgi:hypothetical protein